MVSWKLIPPNAAEGRSGRTPVFRHDLDGLKMKRETCAPNALHLSQILLKLSTNTIQTPHEIC